MGFRFDLCPLAQLNQRIYLHTSVLLSPHNLKSSCDPELTSYHISAFQGDVRFASAILDKAELVRANRALERCRKQCEEAFVPICCFACIACLDLWRSETALSRLGYMFLPFVAVGSCRLPAVQSFRQRLSLRVAMVAVVAPGSTCCSEDAQAFQTQGQ